MLINGYNLYSAEKIQKPIESALLSLATELNISKSIDKTRPNIVSYNFPTSPSDDPESVPVTIEFLKTDYFAIEFTSGSRQGTIAKIIGLEINSNPMSKWGISDSRVKVKYVTPTHTGTIPISHVVNQASLKANWTESDLIYIFSKKAPGTKLFINVHGQEMKLGDWVIVGRILSGKKIKVEVGKIKRFTEKSIWYEDLYGQEQYSKSADEAVFLLDMETPFEDQLMTWKLAGRIV